VVARTTLWLGVFLFSYLVSIHAAWLEGTVKGPDRDVIKAAEIHFERLDAKAPVAAAKIDAKGHYLVNNLAVGTYEVILMVNKAPVVAGGMWTRPGGGVRVDFELKAKGKTNIRRYVWFAAETGSHLGGQWVGIDEQGKAAPGVNPVNAISGAELRKMSPGNSSGR
jgi:hypothetical protein